MSTHSVPKKIAKSIAKTKASAKPSAKSAPKAAIFGATNIDIMHYNRALSSGVPSCRIEVLEPYLMQREEALEILRSESLIQRQEAQRSFGRWRAHLEATKTLTSQDKAYLREYEHLIKKGKPLSKDFLKENLAIAHLRVPAYVLLPAIEDYSTLMDIMSSNLYDASYNETHIVRHGNSAMLASLFDVEGMNGGQSLGLSVILEILDNFDTIYLPVHKALFSLVMRLDLTAAPDCESKIVEIMTFLVNYKEDNYFSALAFIEATAGMIFPDRANRLLFFVAARNGAKGIELVAQIAVRNKWQRRSLSQFLSLLVTSSMFLKLSQKDAFLKAFDKLVNEQ